MRYNRVLLISPPTSSYLGAARPPQNLGYLAESLFQAGIDYDVLDMRLKHNRRRVHQKIQEFHPDLIGVTLVSLEYLRSYALIETLKRAYPHMTIVAGGPHVLPGRQGTAESLVRSGSCDIAVAGTMEAFLDLLSRIEDGRAAFQNHRFQKGTLPAGVYTQDEQGNIIGSGSSVCHEQDIPLLILKKEGRAFRG